MKLSLIRIWHLGKYNRSFDLIALPFCLFVVVSSRHFVKVFFANDRTNKETSSAQQPMAQQEEEEEDTKYDATIPLMTGNPKEDITNINPRQLYLQESAPSSDDGNQLFASV